jgi:hypothetical protein
MLLVATCSAALSAACHQPEEDFDACLLPVQWGLVSDEITLPSHRSYTTYRFVREPKKVNTTYDRLTREQCIGTDPNNCSYVGILGVSLDFKKAANIDIAIEY